MLGAAEARREAIGAPHPDRYRDRHERRIASARAELGADVFATAWSAGRSLALDRALDEARAVAAEVLAASDAATTLRSPSGAANGRVSGVANERVSCGPNGLTCRALDVLRLLAAGRTDREIAEALFISRRTVTTHVRNMLREFGVDRRAAAAVIAAHQGLI